MNLDLSRNRGSFIVLIATAIALSGYGVVINAALGRHNRRLLDHDHTLMEVTSIEVGSQRVLGIARKLASGDGQAAEPFGVLIGASTLAGGINPDLLKIELGGGHSWSNLVVTGYAHETNLIAQLMYDNGLRPDELILVLSPGLMMAKANFPDERIGYDLDLVRKHALGMRLGYLKEDLSAISLVPWNLAFPYRGQVFSLVSRSLFAGKLRILSSQGMGLEALFAPDPRPWNESESALAYAPTTTDEAKRDFLRKTEDRGWFDPLRYRSDGPNFSMIVETLRLAHARGTKSFVVLVPESPSVKALLPRDAADRLMHDLMETLGNAAPVVFDLRDGMPEELFRDARHLNKEGMLQFTKRLAESLKPYMASGNSDKVSTH